VFVFIIGLLKKFWAQINLGSQENWGYCSRTPPIATSLQLSSKGNSGNTYKMKKTNTDLFV